ncbi:MAG: hypothetical protein Q4P31_02725 [Andreesenia angusta]|nr:hypothetical protein [Andreesenia angusta]
MHVDYYRVKGKINLRLKDDSKKIELALNPDMHREMDGIICCSDYNSGRSVINNIMQFNEITLQYFSGNIGKLEWKFEDSLKHLVESDIFWIQGEIEVSDSMYPENNFSIKIDKNNIKKEKLNN